MSKGTRKEERSPFQPWMTTSPSGIEKKYVRIGLTMVKTDAFKALTGGEMKTLFALYFHAAGRETLTFTRLAMNDAGITKPAFYRALDGLIEKGFIHVERHTLPGQPNTYTFARDWADWKRPNLTNLNRQEPKKSNSGSPPVRDPPRRPGTGGI